MTSPAAADVASDDKRNSSGSVNMIESALKGQADSDDANMKVYGHAEHVTYTDEEAKRVLRKIDLILLPMLGACYMFSVRKCPTCNSRSVLIRLVLKFLDKTLINYGSIFGLKRDLNLKGSNYSWLGSIFYIGYMIGVMVWAKLVQRWPQHAGKFITGAILVWSTIILLSRKYTSRLPRHTTKLTGASPRF